MSVEPGRRQSWSLQDGLDPRSWPDDVRTASAPLRQGLLVLRPPLVYAADAAHPIHATTVAWSRSDKAPTGAVNVRADELRPEYGLIVTQTCDLVEEGVPKRPWFMVAPVYRFRGDKGQRSQIRKGRGFTYLCHISALPEEEDAIWVADLRLLVPIEKGWLVQARITPAFKEEAEYDRLQERLAASFSRTAFARVSTDHVLSPTFDLLKRIAAEYQGADPIVEVGVMTGRSRVDPTNAQVVFMIDGDLPDELRTEVLEWWETTAQVASAAGLETLVPRFVNLDELTAREYRALDILDASAFSPADDD